MSSSAVTSAHFFSILSALDAGDARRAEDAEPPAFFRDLNLDQVERTILGGLEAYRLEGVFRTSLRTSDEVVYRQEVFRDIESDTVARALSAFAQDMSGVRERRDHAERLYYKFEKARWFLAAADAYCEAVNTLERDLNAMTLASRGLRAFRDYLTTYLESPSFKHLQAETVELVRDLSGIRYTLLIEGSSVTVHPYRNESDYSAVVVQTFEKFTRGSAHDYRAKFSKQGGLNHVEAAVLDRVALLNPQAFQTLDAFTQRHAAYVDEAIARFDREVQFYLAYLAFVRRFRKADLSFCYPSASDTDKRTLSRNAFDVALACKLTEEKVKVVCSDVELNPEERILIVSGPNHGGKTTFAKMFGQLHYLASLGCPVPGTEAHLNLFDQLFTHFEREEDIATLRGKLKDDLIRLRHILDAATSESVVILNEIFSSTTLRDATFLSKKMLARISQRDILCVCVTFIAELASFDQKTVSMVGLVAPVDPSARTYKFERRRADGLAYAAAIAEKYHVTYDWLKRRIA